MATDRDRLDGLEAAVMRLFSSQQAIEDRLARIEKALEIEPAPAAMPLETKAGSERQPPQAVRDGEVSIPPDTADFVGGAPQTAPPGSRFETRMGLTLVNRIGVITLVLGVAFFFKYAVDNQWIGEAGRVGLGIAAGLLLIAAADRLRRREQGIFAHGISGAGIAILYVSLYAAFGFYSLIGQPAAFALMAANTVLAGLLSLRYGSPAIAALGLAGGYLTPVVLSSGRDAPWFFFGYLFLLGCGAATFGRLRSWRVLDGLAAVATLWLYLTWVSRHFEPGKRTVGSVFALLFYCLFATRPWRSVALLAPFAAFLELVAISSPQPHPFMTLAPIVAAIGLVLADRMERPESAVATFAAFWAPYSVAHFSFRDHGSREGIAGLLTLVAILFFAWPLWRVYVRRAAVTTLTLAVVVLNAGLYFAAAYDLLGPAHRPFMGLLALGVATAHAVFGRMLPDKRVASAYIGVALGMLTLAVPVEFTGFRITMVWALQAAALAWVANRNASQRMTWASAAVFWLVAVRLLGWDTGIDADALLWNARFLTFLISAVALWLAARWTAARIIALVLYVGGHAVLLWSLVLEVLSWAHRSSAPAEIWNVQSTAVSILLAAYAVVLVGMGVAKRFALDRILGLGLIATVVAKLYLYDVWRVSRGMYRVAAFAGLGALLLAMSYLYSRYRGTVEALWRDEQGSR